MQMKKFGLLWAAMGFAAVGMISAVGCGPDTTTCADGGTSCNTNDAGTDAGTGATACNSANVTLGTNGGPDVCAYGTFCDSTNVCMGAPVGSCTEATKAGAVTWDSASKQAPVITGISATVKMVTNTMTECQSGGPAGIVTIKFYAPHNLTTHTSFNDLLNHVKVRGGGSTFIGPGFKVQAPPPNATSGDLIVGICGQPTDTFAVYIADEDGRTSNVSCVSW